MSGSLELELYVVVSPRQVGAVCRLGLCKTSLWQLSQSHSGKFLLKEFTWEVT